MADHERSLIDRIRRRAYEIWERVGQTGDPEDHWLEAERELTTGSDDRPEATLGDAAPVERAMLFGAQQLALQHRGLWDLLEARRQARLDP